MQIRAVTASLDGVGANGWDSIHPRSAEEASTARQLFTAAFGRQVAEKDVVDRLAAERSDADKHAPTSEQQGRDEEGQPRRGAALTLEEMAAQVSLRMGNLVDVRA
ncbi:MAG TPA: hypothetical protein VMV93_14075 [Chloroflexota bacterium]|nr:hypothetical protein [Chloroflexota bacterium]